MPDLILSILTATANLGVFLGWTLAYLLLARDAHTHKTAGAPLLVLTSMIAYEVSATMIWPVMKQSLLFGLFEWLWLGIDFFLLSQLWAYADPKWKHPRYFLAGFVVLLLSIWCTVTMIHEFGLEDMGVPGVLFGAIISAVFFPFVWKHPHPNRLSLRAQVARLIGDICIVASIWLVFPNGVEGSPNNSFTSALSATMLSCDVATVLMLYIFQKNSPRLKRRA